MPPRGPPQAAEYKGDPVRSDKVDDVWDNLSQTARKLLILKRRDVRVVEGARLESVCRGNSTVGSNPTLSANFQFRDPVTASRTALRKWDKEFRDRRYSSIARY